MTNMFVRLEGNANFGDEIKPNPHNENVINTKVVFTMPGNKERKEKETDFSKRQAKLWVDLEIWGELKDYVLKKANEENNFLKGKTFFIIATPKEADNYVNEAGETKTPMNIRAKAIAIMPADQVYIKSTQTDSSTDAEQNQSKEMPSIDSNDRELDDLMKDDNLDDLETA